MDSLLVKVVLQFLYTVLTLFRGGVHTSPTSDTHHTCGRRFNAEKANLFSGIKHFSRFSSHLVLRNSLLITLSRLKPLLQVIHITHVGGVLTPKKQTHSAISNNLHGIARIPRLVALTTNNLYAENYPINTEGILCI
jgi:hypothetical protein